MPGIYGYFLRSVDELDAPKRRLAQMVEVVERHHNTSVSEFSSSRFAGCNQRFPDRFDSPSNTLADVVVFLDGYIVNRKEVLEQLAGRGVKCQSNWCDETLAKLAYRLLGNDTVSLLRGVFNICVFDQHKLEMTLLNCRHGARHLYYTLSDHFMAFATEPRAIAALGDSPPTVDRRSLCDMFNFGYIGGQRTLFGHVQLLEPGSIVTVNSGGAQFRKYWDYEFQNTEDRQPFTEYVDEGICLLDQAVSRYSDRFESLGIPISGGLDSRAILAFSSQGARSRDVYHCSWYSKEEAIAKEISQICGARWHVYDPIQFDYKMMLELGFGLSDGAIHAHQFWFLPVVEEISTSEEVDLLLDGYLMDVYLGDTFLALRSRDNPTNEELRSIVNRFWRRCSPFFAKQIFLPEFFTEYERQNVESIDEELGKLEESDISNLIHRYSFANRSNRYSVALPNVQRQFVEYGYPGLDYDLTDFYLRIPPVYKKDAGLYRSIIQRKFPDVAAVPWAKTGNPLTKGKTRIDLIMDRFPIRAIGAKLLLRATNGRLDWSHRGDLNRSFRKNGNFREAYTSILRDRRTHSRGIVDSRGTERLIGLIDGGWPLFTFVQTLVTIELWYRRFVDG